MNKKKKLNNHLPPISPPLPAPVKFYPNSDTCKAKILSDNKNKSGIYM
jgi:hypothetical protein